MARSKLSVATLIVGALIARVSLPVEGGNCSDQAPDQRQTDAEDAGLPERLLYGQALSIVAESMRRELVLPPRVGKRPLSPTVSICTQKCTQISFSRGFG